MPEHRQKGNVVIGKEVMMVCWVDPCHQSYYLGLASADAPWGYTAGYPAGAETVVIQKHPQYLPRRAYGVLSKDTQTVSVHQHCQWSIACQG